jgi:hypothetical protein
MKYELFIFENYALKFQTIKNNFPYFQLEIYYFARLLRGPKLYSQDCH